MSTELRILMLEDVPSDSELIRRELRNGGLVFTSRRVETSQDFTGALCEFGPDLILSDHSLPLFDGLSALEIVKERQLDLPFIFVTGSMGEELAIETLKKGATDYVLKDHLARLVPAVKRALHEAEEHRERRAAESALRESESRYKKLVESITDYIYTVRVEDGRPIETIHGLGCAGVTGYSSEEFQRDPHLWFKVIYEHDRDTAMAQVNKILEGDKAQPFEHRIVRKDGSVRWVSNTPVARYDENRCLVAYDGLISDITERKTAEEELNRRVEELERFRKATIQREFRMKELKERIGELERRIENPGPGGAVGSPQGGITISEAP